QRATAPHRVVAARRSPVLPRISLAARFPLAGNPPAPDLFRLRRVLEVEDHADIADIALGGRRDIGVAAVEIVAMHPLSVGAPFGDELWRGRLRHVIDAEPAAER